MSKESHVVAEGMTEEKCEIVCSKCYTTKEHKNSSHCYGCESTSSMKQRTAGSKPGKILDFSLSEARRNPPKRLGAATIID